MKKTEIKNAIKQLRKCANAFEEGNAKECAAAIRALIDEWENAEESIGVDEVVTKITEAIEAYKKESEGKTAEVVAAEVANQLASKLKSVSNSVKTELPMKVKNAVCKAVLNSTKENMKADVEKVLVENGISGLSFNDVIDFTIVTDWENLNPIFGKLKKVPFTKFFYSDQTLADKEILAKQWAKTSETEKDIQEIEANARQITPDYIYKRQQFAMSDLDDIRESQGEASFLGFINRELDMMIENTVVMHILIGDTTNDASKRISTFESIGAKTVTDLFTTVFNPASTDEGDITIIDLRTIVDAIHNPNGDPITLVMNRSLLTQISEFVYGEGGSTIYHTKAEVAGMLGVADIFESDLLSPNSGSEAAGAVYAVAFIGNEYWYKEKNTISVAYPEYKNNVMNYQKERNMGGKIHGIKSTAVLKKASV